MTKLVDIHSHDINANTDVLCITNIRVTKGNYSFTPYNSVGIHPWDIESNNQINHAFTELEQIANQDSIVAIGECGLDIKCSIDFDLQIYAFQQQIILANNIKKPLIIHCVRAYYEVISLLKKLNSQVPIIFHKYSGNKEITDLLLKQITFFSFGFEMMNNTKQQQIFCSIPLSQIFLETDDSERDIIELYTFASVLLQIPLDTLIIEIEKNFRKLFIA